MLTERWFPLKYHRLQSELWRCDKRFVAVVAGRGSGKTELARRRVVRYLPIKKPWSDPEYFYAMPTFGHARRVAWEPIKKLIPEDWISDINETTMVVKTVFGSTLRIIGLDRPMRFEGLQYDGGVLDESSDQKPRVFDITFRPALTHRKAWCWRIGVPKRFGAGAQEFRTFFEKCRTLNDGLHAGFTWASSTILDPAEIEASRSSMDEKDFNEQMGGLWETIAGLVYYGFSDLSIKPHKYNPEAPLLIGSDFNVDPMAWVIGQAANGTKLDFIHIFDELWERNTNTQRSLDMLFKRYENHKGGWFFFGDATGRARRSSASSSDYAQIRNDIRFANAKVLYNKSNPMVSDRVASVNAMLKNAKGERRLFIDPRCKHLIRDLEYLSYQAGSREISTSDPDAKHITDALGYLIHYLRPVKSSFEHTTEIYAKG